MAASSRARFRFRQLLRKSVRRSRKFEHRQGARHRAHLVKKSVGLGWAPHAIRVNAVAPTYVRTELIGPILKDPELIARIEAMTPLRKLAEPADIAAAIALLAGPAAAMISGHTLAVDGGFLAQ